jgi:diketogulonate reductase-like aldo/keto reductase
METVTLNNGVEMPLLGLGVFQTPSTETREAVGARAQMLVWAAQSR